MYSHLICLAVLIVAVANASMVPMPPVVQEHMRNIVVVNDISEFARNHPGLDFKAMAKNTGKARSNTVNYTLGARVSGDRLVAQGADVFAYPAKKDIAIQLTYPEAGTGSILTFIEIVCQQDNYEGNAYVVAGGIEQRFISIVLEAKQTETFSYTAQYYGVN